MFVMRSYHHPEEEWLLKNHAKFLLTWLVGTPYNNHSSFLMIFGYGGCSILGVLQSHNSLVYPCNTDALKCHNQNKDCMPLMYYLQSSQ